MTMKAFREWREDTHRNESGEVLIDRLDELSNTMMSELQSFKGEGFEGNLELIGAVKQLKQTIAALKAGIETPKWLSQ